MRTEARPPRRKWPWILTGVAVVALLIAAGVWFGTRAIDAPANPTAAPSPSAPADVEPTGCLGGNTRDAAMVLAAQEAAPHTSNGAVEVAAAFERWVTRYPVASQSEAEQLEAALMAPDAPDLAGSLASEPNLSAGLVPTGTPFYVSTVPGVWNLESYSNDEAVVSIGTGVVIDGALHPAFRISSMYTLNWGETGWTIAAANQPRPTEQLFPIGTGFTEGC